MIGKSDVAISTKLQPIKDIHSPMLPSELMTLTEVIASLCPSNICVHTPADFHTLVKIKCKSLYISYQALITHKLIN